MSPLNGTFLRHWQFLPLPQSLLVFTARSYEALFSRHWNPGLRGLAWGWVCMLSRYPSRFLSTIHECGTAHCTGHLASKLPPLCSHIASSLPRLPSSGPPTHVEWDFFKPLVVRLPYSSIFWVFFSSGCFCFEVSSDPSCGYVRRQSVSTYASILTRNQISKIM